MNDRYAPQIIAIRHAQTEGVQAICINVLIDNVKQDTLAAVREVLENRMLTPATHPSLIGVLQKSIDDIVADIKKHLEGEG